MKRLLMILMVLSSIFMTGCVSFPYKVYDKIDALSLPTTKIYIEEPLLYKEGRYGLEGIEDLGKLADADDPYYRNLKNVYQDVLKQEFEKNGLIVVDRIEPKVFVVKTKIVEHPPALGGWIGSLGMIGARVELYQGEKKLLEFEEGVNINLIVRSESQIKRWIGPRVSNKIKNFIENSQ